MPTTNPRISITVNREDLAVLDRYAEASGTPRASMIASMIHASVPELERAAELMEMARAAPAGVINGLVEDLHNATADAMGFLEPFNADYRRAMKGLDEGLVRAGVGKAMAAPGAAAPMRGPGTGTQRRGGTGGRGVRPDPHLLTGGSKS